MIRLRHKVLLGALRVLDLFIVLFSFALSALVVDPEHVLSLGARWFSQNVEMKHVLVGALLIISWHVAFAFFVRYETHRFTSRFTQIKRVLKAVTISVFLVWAIDIVLRVHLVTARFLLVFWATSSGLCIVMRLVTRQLLTVVRRSGLNQRHILFVGSSRRALDFAQRIARTEELGYRIIGFATHDPDSVESVRQAGYRALGDMDEVPQIFKREVVDELMICLPIMDYFTEVVDIVRRCQDQGIVVRFAPETFDFRLLTKTQIERFDGDYVVTFFRQNLFWQLVLKGLMDYSVASAVILICLPLFAVVAVLIKLTSAGPVFFTQERVGMNKRRFTLYKFRTMVANAEELRKDLEELNAADGPGFNHLRAIRNWTQTVAGGRESPGCGEQGDPFDGLSPPPEEEEDRFADPREPGEDWTFEP